MIHCYDIRIKLRKNFQLTAIPHTGNFKKHFPCRSWFNYSVIEMLSLDLGILTTSSIVTNWWGVWKTLNLIANNSWLTHSQLFYFGIYITEAFGFISIVRATAQYSLDFPLHLSQLFDLQISKKVYFMKPAFTWNLIFAKRLTVRLILLYEVVPYTMISTLPNKNGLCASLSEKVNSISM